MNVSQVQIRNLTNPSSGELSDLFIRYCEFCFKKCNNTDENFEICQILSDNYIHYCEFCIRNNFHSSRKNNILILSFKSIFAWFYHQNYLAGINRKMWYHEVRDYIESHREIGLKNPLFVYDEKTMYWFVDFSRVGEGQRKVNLDFIKNHITLILSCFKLNRNVSVLDIEKFTSKYFTAIDEFYQKRERPNGKRILCPTFIECLPADVKIPYEKMKNFNISVMECKKYS